MPSFGKTESRRNAGRPAAEEASVDRAVFCISVSCKRGQRRSTTLSDGCRRPPIGGCRSFDHPVAMCGVSHRGPLPPIRRVDAPSTPTARHEMRLRGTCPCARAACPIAAALGTCGSPVRAATGWQAWEIRGQTKPCGKNASMSGGAAADATTGAVHLAPGTAISRDVFRNRISGYGKYKLR